MFNHTIPDKRININIPKIDNFFINANDKKHIQYLSGILKLDEFSLKQYNSWYNINGKLYYYKNHFIFNELFLSELIKEYRLTTPNYSLAIVNNELGIVSESIKNNDSQYFDYDLFFENTNTKIPRNILSLEEFFKNNISDKNKEELMNEFYRLTAFDWFSGQTDRSDTNVIFKIDKDIHLAPIIDSGSSLHYVRFQKKKYDILYTSYYSSFENLSFPTDDLLDSDHMYLFDLINNSIEFYNYLCKSLDIDIYKILKNTSEKYKLLIPNFDRKEVNDFFEVKKRILENTLKLAKKYR